MDGIELFCSNSKDIVSLMSADLEDMKEHDRKSTPHKPYPMTFRITEKRDQRTKLPRYSVIFLPHYTFMDSRIEFLEKTRTAAHATEMFTKSARDPRVDWLTQKGTRFSHLSSHNMITHAETLRRQRNYELWSLHLTDVPIPALTVRPQG